MLASDRNEKGLLASRTERLALWCLRDVTLAALLATNEILVVERQIAIETVHEKIVVPPSDNNEGDPKRLVFPS
jgi:hypothetical protein